MQKSTFAAIVVFAFIFIVFGNLAVAEDFVVIKNGNTLITYKAHVSSSTEQVYMIETNTYTTGTDLMTLKGLNIPAEAWPLFANNDYLIYSSAANELYKESKNVQEDLDNTKTERTDAEDSLTTYRILFWFTLVILFIVSIVFIFYYREHRKN